MTKKQRKKKKTKRSRSTRSAGHVSSSSHHSSLEESESSHGPDDTHDEPTDGPDGTHVEPDAPSAAAASPSAPAAEQTAAFESPRAESKSSRGQHSAGTWKADQARAQLRMQRVLGTVEASHTKPKPVFPQSVLGHLFMRKFGLSKEQRAQVIRATGGSSRFADIERILRASDFEESKSDDRRGSRPPQKVQRREAYAIHVDNDDDDSSLDMPFLQIVGMKYMLGNMRLKFKDRAIPPMKISKKYLRFKRKPRETSNGISRLTRTPRRKFERSRNHVSHTFQ